MDEETGNVTSGKYEIPKDKCYNEYIGKVIALSKALGLDYSKFENAVEPDKVVKDMILSNINFNDLHFIIFNVENHMVSLKSHHNGDIYHNFISVDKIDNHYKITDDTDAQY